MTQAKIRFEDACRRGTVDNLPEMLDDAVSAAETCLRNIQRGRLSDYENIEPLLYQLCLNNASVRRQLAERLYRELGIPESQWRLGPSSLTRGCVSIFVWVPANYVDVQRQVVDDTTPHQISKVVQAASQCLNDLRERPRPNACCPIPWSIYQACQEDEKILNTLATRLEEVLSLPRDGWWLAPHPENENQFLIFVTLTPQSE